MIITITLNILMVIGLLFNKYLYNTSRSFPHTPLTYFCSKG